LYNHPVNTFVAGFIGSPKMNLITGAEAEKLGATTIGVRPERIALSSEPASDNSVPVTLKSCAFLGSHIDVVLTGAGQQRLSCQLSNNAVDSQRGLLQAGTRLFMNFKATDCVVFSERGGR
jgi:ABC-type sugar transport system ATPase subunit